MVITNSEINRTRCGKALWFSGGALRVLFALSHTSLPLRASYTYVRQRKTDQRSRGRVA